MPAKKAAKNVAKKAAAKIPAKKAAKKAAKKVSAAKPAKKSATNIEVAAYLNYLSLIHI
jgi:hypothetical protein